MFLKDCRFWQDFIVCFFGFFSHLSSLFQNNLKDFVNKRIFLVSCFLDVLIVFCKRKIRMQRFNHFITDLFLESNLYFRILISLAYSEKYSGKRSRALFIAKIISSVFNISKLGKRKYRSV